MFDKEDLIRKELKIDKSGRKFTVGVYPCKSCKVVYLNFI